MDRVEENGRMNYGIKLRQGLRHTKGHVCVFIKEINGDEKATG